MYVNVPYFRYRKDGSIHKPTVSSTFSEAMGEAKKWLIGKDVKEQDVSVYFYEPTSDRESEACATHGINVINELDGNNSGGIYDAICEVVEKDGYCCYAVVIYQI